MVGTNLKTMNKHCPELKWTRKKPCHHLTGKPTHYALIVGFPRGSTPADLFLPSNKISNDNYNSNNNNNNNNYIFICTAQIQPGFQMRLTMKYLNYIHQM